jgi:hypothetical protein
MHPFRFDLYGKNAKQNSKGAEATQNPRVWTLNTGLNMNQLLKKSFALMALSLGLGLSYAQPVKLVGLVELTGTGTADQTLTMASNSPSKKSTQLAAFWAERSTTPPMTPSPTQVSQKAWPKRQSIKRLTWCSDRYFLAPFW